METKFWPGETELPEEGRKRMDDLLGEVWSEHQRIKRHRDFMVKQVRDRKQIASEQEQTIQRLAAERKELRSEVDGLVDFANDDALVCPLDKSGRRIHVGDRIMYGDFVGEVLGMEYRLETFDWKPAGYKWSVTVGKRIGDRIKPGHYKVAPKVLEVIDEDEPADSYESVLEDYISYCQHRQFVGTAGDKAATQSFIDRLEKIAEGAR